MPTPDKLEAVKKVSETLNKQSNPAEDMERMASTKEHFQSLVDSTQPMKTSFERLDTKAFTVEDVQSMETKQPALADENVSSKRVGLQRIKKAKEDVSSKQKK